MRRGGGINALLKNKEQAEKFKERGQELQQMNLAQVKEQLEVFKKSLESFAEQYKDQLKKDPEFRQYFNELCSKIGVDPLVSSKGFWGQLLGVGDFYYELGVQIVEICIQTRPVNGGLMDMDDILAALRKKRGGVQKGKLVNKDDIERAVKQLGALGSGFQIIRLGSKKILQSVPYQLSNDHTTVLELAQADHFVTKDKLVKELHWAESRCELVLEQLLEEGIAWIDSDPNTSELLYWFPTLYFGAQSKVAPPNSLEPLPSSSLMDTS
jgi:ESCRT-II complex subunit VPS22